MSLVTGSVFATIIPPATLLTPEAFMKRGVAGSRSILIIPLFAMISFATIFTQARAQTVARPPSGTNPAGGARTSETTQPPSILERQYLMRAMEIEAGKPSTREGKRLALTQIAEDYARIQIINNKMMGAAMSATVLNYASIANTTAEIGERAGRIRINLPLPDDDKDDKKGRGAKRVEYQSVVDPASMKASLLLLDARIMSFINN